jgi:4'-phosphopantetheinyl transferase
VAVFIRDDFGIMTEMRGISVSSHDSTAGSVVNSAAVPELHPGQVHAWSVDLDGVAPMPQSLLSVDEMDRANRLIRRTHRTRFVNGRSILRILLGGYLQTDPAALRFTYGLLGKPSLQSRHPELRFNVSHSENAMLIAITTVGAIGVDIEQHRSLADEGDLVKRFFEPAEISEYMGLPPSLRTAGFFNGWTRKEAILKARGDGLNTPLDSFSVSLDPRQPCRIREFLTLPEFREDWSLLSIKPDSQSTAALAIKARSVRLCEYRFGTDRSESLLTALGADADFAAGTHWIQLISSP